MLTETGMAMSHSVFPPKNIGLEAHVVGLQDSGVSMLPAERESIVFYEDIHIKKIILAATLLVARLDRVSLPGGAAMAALNLAGLIEEMQKFIVNDPHR